MAVPFKRGLVAPNPPGDPRDPRQTDARDGEPSLGEISPVSALAGARAETVR